MSTSDDDILFCGVSTFLLFFREASNVAMSSLRFLCDAKSSFNIQRRPPALLRVLMDSPLRFNKQKGHHSIKNGTNVTEEDRHHHLDLLQTMVQQ